jgi:hypothetical protein
MRPTPPRCRPVDAQADARADRGGGEAGAEARFDPSQAALCPPGRHEPAGDRDPRQCARCRQRAYKRYLEKHFRDTFNLVGTPLRIELRTGKNPFAKGEISFFAGTPCKKSKQVQWLRSTILPSASGVSAEII